MRPPGWRFISSPAFLETRVVFSAQLETEKFTVYTEVCMEPSLTWFLMQKLWISDIWGTQFWCSTQSECKTEYLDSFRVVNLAFWYLFCFYRTRCHGLPYALPNMLSYLYGNFAPFLLVTIFSTIPGVTECRPIHFQ